MSDVPRRRLLTEWTLLACLLAALGVATGQLQLLARADTLFYDLSLRVWQRPAPTDVVIVAIDDESLAQIGRWPWSRTVHAALVDELTRAGARAVAMDIIFSEADEYRADAQLAAAVRRNGRVVLPVHRESWQNDIGVDVLPIPPLADTAAALGHVHMPLDADGMARSVRLHEDFARRRYPQLALALLQVAGGKPAAAAFTADTLAIPFLGPPGHVQRISYARVLQGQMPPEALRDKLVLVGATAAGLGDAYPTPVSGDATAMPGVEIHANVLEALRHGPQLLRDEGWRAGLLAALLAVALLLALFRLPPRAGLVASALAMVVALAASLIVLRGLALWVSPVAALLCCALAYPLWSWRRLEAAQDYLDAELQRLDAEPDAFLFSAPVPVTRSADPVMRRIDAVRRAIEKKRAVRRFVSETLQELPAGVVVADAAGRVLLTNRRAPTLLSLTEQVGGDTLDSLLRGVSWQSGPGLEGLLRQARDEGRLALAECETRQGRLLVVGVAPFHSAAGQLDGYIVNFADVSELRAAQRVRDDTMRFLSHDLRAPLASIVTLLSDGPGDARHQRIERCARAALALADDFFRLARVEAVDPERFEPVALAPVCEEAIDDVWDLARARRCGVRLETPARELWVRGDRGLLRRALRNLLDNAIHYSPEGGSVTVRLAEGDGMCSIIVADRGYGIAPEHLGRLFTRFTRLKVAGHPERPGTGLGLVFVRTTVMRHGGTVQVRSEAGRGSEFEIILPALAGAPADVDGRPMTTV